jgi:hypothetical protein
MLRKKLAIAGIRALGIGQVILKKINTVIKLDQMFNSVIIRRLYSKKDILKRAEIFIK